MGWTVEVEETVCIGEDPKNGTSSLWCYGSPILLRIGERVFLSVQKVGEGVIPRCCTRPHLLMRDGGGWQSVWRPDDYPEREPCPFVCFDDGALLLSFNPLARVTEAGHGIAHPHLLRFSAHDLIAPPQPVQPVWDGTPNFSIYSYRGIGVDGARGDLLLLHVDAANADQCWSLRDASGAWVKCGRIRFPIRACYPQVALRHRAAHVLAIGDVVEPNLQWRNYKYEVTQRHWDYAFRRLFFTWTPDVSTSDFAPSIEVGTVDETGGHITNLDLWLDADGVAHLLYLKHPVVPILRDRFFPRLPFTRSLEYCVIRRGEVVNRETLVIGGEGITGDLPIYARFHATPDGRLFVVYSCVPPAMKVMQVLPQRAEPTGLPLNEPLRTFFTATERGGSHPSDVIDLFGDVLVGFPDVSERPLDVLDLGGVTTQPQRLQYVRVRHIA